MRGLGDAELLDVWERGVDQSPTRRAMLLLAAACPETSDEELGGLPLGQRDGRLLRLREWLFGPRLTVLTECGGCHEVLESSFRTEDIGSDLHAPPAPIGLVAVDGYQITFRVPASVDLLALDPSGDAVNLRRALLSRCLVEARAADGKTVAASELPEDVVSAVARQMAAADPLADVTLALACPTCGHRWRAVFDIASFLWKEIHAWAQRTLREVSALARVYGWREPDVLALSPMRRQRYLELGRQ